MRIETTKPVDLLVLVALTLGAVLATGTNAPAVLRVPLGLFLILVAPGYAFIALLYPERRTLQTQAARVDRPEPLLYGLDSLARAALSLGASISLVVLVGVGLNYTTGVTFIAVASALALLTLALAGGAIVRRFRLPDDERFLVKVDLFPIVPSRAMPDRILSIALGAAVIIAILTGVYVLAQPRHAVPFTETYILGSDGLAGCYPAVFQDGAYQHPEGEPCSSPAGQVTFGLANHEGTTTTYWVRTVWTAETRQADNTTVVQAVIEWRHWIVELDSQPVDTEPGLPHRVQHEETLDLPPPPGPGTWRLSFQVYLEPPSPVEANQDFLESPYRRAHVWITNETA
ncbi:MAG: DUF1616 domain-containing protein [Candidatus Thermoplasmatota archaeon]